LNSYDVLVIGAGAAGLAAGRTLTAAGLRVAIVEARNRIGGRIFTQHETVPGLGNVAVEVGAEFIHGLPSTTWNLVREARLDTYERDGTHLCFEQSHLQHCSQQQGQTFQVLSDMQRWLQKQPAGTDLTFDDYAHARQLAAAVADGAAGYVEGFNAADRRLVGVAGLARQQVAEDLIQGDRIFYIRGGYEALPQFLCREFTAQGGTLLLNHPVRTVRWSSTGVSMFGHDTSGDEFVLNAKQLISTLPLGVLQSGAVAFEPELPALAAHASRMRMGAVLRVSLVLKTQFWRDPAQLAKHPSIATELQDLSFLFAKETVWPTWWTSSPDLAPVLTGWVAGPKAALLEPGGLTDRAIQDAARIFDLPATELRTQVVGAHCHDWQRDRYSQGAYSYVPAGAIDAPEKMSRPDSDTLFHAGEHTDLEGHWGTVHAALNSGLRAAAQLLQARS
jgi:monoamine oxidase